MSNTDIDRRIELDEDACRQYIDMLAAFIAWEQARFMGNKQRATSLAKALVRHQRMNWALRVGHAPHLLTDILMRLYKLSLSDNVIVSGPCSLYAYEAAAGVRFCGEKSHSPSRHRLVLNTSMELVAPVLETVKKADKTFVELQDVIVNSRGFSVEVRVVNLTGVERFSSIVVAKSGYFARMNTAPLSIDEQLLHDNIVQRLGLIRGA
ncbi:hypothetical protein [Pelotalea chapellei]|uniref:Uncharacterized protein n=1 Tax=Pelotalea chapellei TaxID=44671 RepID=A0ABS5U3T6_9BACT|nr:hypothetical protein [Pelotalea chapellei]MBT1070314.1 hypothetical protein [Pelotalea chapellei]